MAIFNSILDAVGRTPLVKLRRLTAGISAEIYVKAEFMNPGGSIKDRIALRMIDSAEKSGLLTRGGTIVEATAGNTGAGLAMAAAVKGYRMIFVMPDKMSEEKALLLKAFGAEVVIAPAAVPPDSPESYNGVADRLAREIKGAWRPDQFSNPANPQTHYLSTGPEIWEDMRGDVDILAAGMGTGGTISGTSRYLKEKNPSLTVVGADPEGSILSGGVPGSYKVEGIGEDFVPKTFDRGIVDEMIRVSDGESFSTARRLAREEGILAGGSSGAAVAAALKYAARLTGPKKIVAILPDTGRNYLNKFYSDGWMRANGFDVGQTPSAVLAGDILSGKNGLRGTLHYLSPGDSAGQAVALINAYGISQLPVVENGAVVGAVTESALMKILKDGADLMSLEVRAIMGAPLPVVRESTEISEVYRILLSGHSGVVVVASDDSRLRGIITRTDLINILTEPRAASAPDG